MGLWIRAWALGLGIWDLGFGILKVPQLLLHLFAVLVAASTALLIFAGGMVTSTGSGLAVPDWPNTYGWFMFSFPVEHWVGVMYFGRMLPFLGNAF